MNYLLLNGSIQKTKISKYLVYFRMCTGGPGYDTGASLIRHWGEQVAAFAGADPQMDEEGLLQLDIALTLYGYSGSYIQMDEAIAVLGPDGAIRFSCRVAQICEKRCRPLVLASNGPVMKDAEFLNHLRSRLSWPSEADHQGRR